MNALRRQVTTASDDGSRRATAEPSAAPVVRARGDTNAMTQPHLTPTRRRPGAMTDAMTAARAIDTGPKVLRIGVMEGTRMTAERVLRERVAVSLGTTERNTFTVAAEGLPASVEVFSLVGDGYVLHIVEGMTGQVALPDGIRRLDELRKHPKATQTATGWQVALPESSRGRLCLGGVTLLFQFVAAPPAQPRPQLPAAIRAGWVKGIDWTYNGCLSAFLAVAIAGVGYVEYGYDPVVDNELALDDARIVRLMGSAPDVEPEPEPAPDAPATDTAAAATAAPTAAPRRPAPDHHANNAPAPDNATRRADRAAAAATRAVEAATAAMNNSAEFAALVANGGPGGAVDALIHGGLMTGTADDLANLPGVTTASNGTNVRRSSIASANGPGGRNLGGGGLVNSTGNTIGSGPVEVRERRVEVEMPHGTPQPEGGDGEVNGDEVARVLRREIGGIRACYERELRNNPTLSGRLTVSFTLSGTGRALNTAASGLPAAPGVGTCVVTRVRGLVFPVVTGGTVDFTFPFTFGPGT